VTSSLAESALGRLLAAVDDLRPKMIGSLENPRSWRELRGRRTIGKHHSNPLLVNATSPTSPRLWRSYPQPTPPSSKMPRCQSTAANPPD